MHPLRAKELSHASIVEGDVSIASSIAVSLREDDNQEIAVYVFEYPVFDVDTSRTFRASQSHAFSKDTVLILVLGSYTDEALQTLLKTIEEPLGRVQYIFVISSLGALPQPFVSRCQILDSSSFVPRVDTQFNATEFLNASSHKRLATIRSLIDAHEEEGTVRQEAFGFIRSLEVVLGTRLLKERRGESIQALLFAKKILANQAIPVRIALEHLAIALP